MYPDRTSDYMIKRDFGGFLFFDLGFLSRAFMIHRVAGEEGRYLFNFSLPLPPT